MALGLLQQVRNYSQLPAGFGGAVPGSFSTLHLFKVHCIIIAFWHAELNAFIHDHRCVSAPTSPIPRSSATPSPTSFGFKNMSTTLTDHAPTGSDDDPHALVPSSAHSSDKLPSDSCHSVPSVIPASTGCRVHFPPLALHLLKPSAVSSTVPASKSGTLICGTNGPMQECCPHPSTAPTPELTNSTTNKIDNNNNHFDKTYQHGEVQLGTGTLDRTQVDEGNLMRSGESQVKGIGHGAIIVQLKNWQPRMYVHLEHSHSETCLSA